MLNIIKMDLYRMLKTKSMYVIWIVLAAILLITTSLCRLLNLLWIILMWE